MLKSTNISKATYIQADRDDTDHEYHRDKMCLIFKLTVIGRLRNENSADGLTGFIKRKGGKVPGTTGKTLEHKHVQSIRSVSYTHLTLPTTDLV